MTDSEMIEALDVDGNPIVIDSVVRYLNTGTVGRVLELKEDEDGVWVLMDTTGLYYKPETLVLADASEIIKEKIERSSVKDAESYLDDYSSVDDIGADIEQVTGGG
ncbi:DUF2098 domain-containing protein [Methanolobus sp. ZRKC5]|uniref:DUF2098 domain-containing protein n=1 Tax=unclassified Methanolobus TaxID=2629569 RepID=UPI00313E7C26